jgi:phage regulator Rha-like protein
MPDINPFEYDGQLVVDSRLIAEELGIEHENFMATIYSYQVQAEEAFGFFRFQTGKIEGRGRPQKYVLITEDQATFLMTLSRNTSEVVQCKIKLVKAFSAAKKLYSVKSNSYWYKRIGLAMSDSDKPLEAGYFCVYVEMMRFFSELEMRLGYVIDDKNLVTVLNRSGSTVKTLRGFGFTEKIEKVVSQSNQGNDVEAVLPNPWIND